MLLPPDRHEGETSDRILREPDPELVLAAGDRLSLLVPARRDG
jgi:hypothetical protein